MSYNPDNIKVTSGRDSSYRPNDVKGRPSSSPDSKKDFKKVLEKDEEADENQQAATGIIEETDGTLATDTNIALAFTEGAKKKAPSPPSPFELSSTRQTPFFEKTDKPTSNLQPTSNRLQSPAELYGKIENDTKKIDESATVDVNLAMLDKDKFTTRFSTEQTDLSYINPLAAVTTHINPLAAVTTQQNSVNLNPTTEKPMIPTSHIQDIINQMVAKVEEIKNTGSTETVVTLKQPPIFEGARIVVTNFDHAKNEFNITIENLTQQAKNLVDLQANRDTLLTSLHEKGYAVHIITTTTTTETRLVDALPKSEQDKQPKDENREGEGKQQGRNRQNQA